MPLPRLTPEALRGAVLEMCDIAGQMLQLARGAFVQSSPQALEKVAVLGRDLHLREKRLTDHVAMQLREYPWSLGTTEHLAFLPGALERIGDSVEALARCVQGIHRDGIPFSERAFSEIIALFNRAAELVEGVAAAIRTGDRGHVTRVREEGERFQALSDEAALGHQERLIQGECVARASSIFLAMLDYFREIERYTRRMSTDLAKALATT
jgi:Na+/phosphate symporter